MESVSNLKTAYRDLKGMTIQKITKKTVKNTYNNIGKEIKTKNI